MQNWSIFLSAMTLALVRVSGMVAAILAYLYRQRVEEEMRMKRRSAASGSVGVHR
jgi:hypothetical protein